MIPLFWITSSQKVWIFILLVVIGYIYDLVVINTRFLYISIIPIALILTTAKYFPKVVLELTIFYSVLPCTYVVIRHLLKSYSYHFFLKKTNLLFPIGLATLIWLGICGIALIYHVGFKNSGVGHLSFNTLEVRNPNFDSPIGMLIIMATQQIVWLYPFVILLGIREIDIFTLETRQLVGTPLLTRIHALLFTPLLGILFFIPLNIILKSLNFIILSYELWIYLPFIASVSNLIIPTAWSHSDNYSIASLILYILLFISQKQIIYPNIFLLGIATILLYDIDVLFVRIWAKIKYYFLFLKNVLWEDNQNGKDEERNNLFV
jgi:hypothetical protein